MDHISAAQGSKQIDNILEIANYGQDNSATVFILFLFLLGLLSMFCVAKAAHSGRKSWNLFYASGKKFELALETPREDSSWAQSKPKEAISSMCYLMVVRRLATS